MPATSLQQRALNMRAVRAGKVQALRQGLSEARQESVLELGVAVAPASGGGNKGPLGATSAANTRSRSLSPGRCAHTHTHTHTHVRSAYYVEMA